MHLTERSPSAQTAAAADTGKLQLKKILRNAGSQSSSRAVQKGGLRLTASQHRHEIEVTAYALAERRGFVPGHETSDWLIAENRVISRSGIPVT